MKDYDLIVIGGGTAGLVSAAGGASLGAKVALIERDKLGGECLNYGCVPTKALIKSAKVASLMRRAPEFGMREVPVEVDSQAVMDRMRGIVKKAGEPDSPERFRKLGVEVYLDEATFTGERELSVGDSGERLRGRSVLVATGSHATPLPIDGLDSVGYLDNVSVLGLEKLPRSMVVVGSGPIGTEFAQMFTRLGCRVELLSSSPNPLPKDDEEVTAALRGYLEADGVSFHSGFRAEAVRLEDGEKVVTARNKNSGASVEVRGEELLIAAGRAPTVDGLGFENAGIEVGESGLVVDDRLMTTAEGVYAAGDIVGGPLFTHAADYQAKVALQNALFPIKQKVDYLAMPWTTFTDPEVARVGLTEKEAREQRGDVKVFRHSFSDLDRAICDGETEGFVKLVTDSQGKLLGGHIIGPDAGNYIGEVVLALRKNLAVADLSRTVHVYPTLSEGVKRAADNYYRERLFSGPTRKLLNTYFKVRRRLPRNVRQALR